MAPHLALKNARAQKFLLRRCARAAVAHHPQTADRAVTHKI